jgi:hypothetical protein
MKYTLYLLGCFLVGWLIRNVFNLGYVVVFTVIVVGWLVRSVWILENQVAVLQSRLKDERRRVDFAFRVLRGEEEVEFRGRKRAKEVLSFATEEEN